MKRIGVFSVFIFFTVIELTAQPGDSVITLQQVEAIGLRFGNYPAGTRIFSIDSLTLTTYKSGSVADLLALHSLASINSYGPEGLASVSMRGGSTRHTAIIWNGINLRSHASGGFNFSALPAGFVDNLTIQSSGSSTLYGSGTSNGAIVISSNLHLSEPKITGDVNIEAGSFGTISSTGSAGYVSPRFATRLKVGYQISENDFEFKNTQKYNHPIDTLEHAAFNRLAFGQQNVFKTGEHSKFETDFLYTSLNKQVPALMSDYEPGVADQEDKSARLSLNFSTIHNTWFLKIRTGLITDEVWFYDSLDMANPSLNKSFAVLNEAECNLILNNRQSVHMGIDQTNEFAKSSYYIADTSRFRFSVFGRYTFTLLRNKINLAAEGRKEFVTGENAPIVYSFSGSYNFVPIFTLKSIFSKHYSLPVFDDLFWGEDAFSKGNPNLKPENGYAAEMGLYSGIKKHNLKIENEITFYFSEISGLIIWLPDNEGKYTPSNMQNSVSRGIEFSGSVNKELQSIKLYGYYMYAYTDALIYDNITDQHGAQRIYVPKHKATISAGIGIWNFNVNYTQSFFSKRYIDEINSLEPFTLADMITNYSFKLNRYKLSAYFKIKNLYNTSYQVMSGYAQPGRNYCLGINLTL